MKAITQYLKSRGFGCVEDDFYTQIGLWRKWYQGKVPEVHCYRQYNGRKKLRRERKSVGMAKTIAEDWANLALNEKVAVTVGKKTAEKRILAALEDNQFRVRANQLLELSFAMGTGALVEYLEGDRVKIDYIRAGMVYPLAWDNGEITQCAFGSERTEQREKRVYLNIHRLEDGKYVVENHLFRKTGEVLTEIDLPPGTLPEVRTGSALPRFQIIKPNLVNNLDLDCPLGISVYANALDQLEGLDLVYDSYCNEFRLGKKRITIPVTMARMQMEEDGSATPVFDDNDTEFYAIPVFDGAENKIQEHNMELRYEAHESGIQTALNLLAFKCGMGKDRYSFQDSQVKTATEVVSERSDLFQNLKKHELLLESALTRMVRAIAELLGISGELEVSVSFDDSIIEDVGAEKLRFLQEIRDGVRQKWEYRAKFFGETEAAAKAMIAAEAPGDSSLFGGA